MEGKKELILMNALVTCRFTIDLLKKEIAM
jgi:hypothetical protein